ncbi:branched-chain amino acid aminotransferase [Peptoniphilus stercorisuis]|uniref:branched-chain-amino-acid transaminase n=1 Tax=Peptoniphilus stercorisuis TaxID=1436965 RepID=A0ABS4KBD0_9FIRM|nr:branched-chain amino acid aminotransferase [Peptoniphilus stercorisuis]MBP2025068.1 branched-chain amino acid aminotransferase [Peptoniphilus stercorisuis]
MNIRIERAKNLKEKPEGALGFGKNFTDHMFVMDWSRDKGWYDERIIPYGPMVIDPVAMVLHYAQETFEGLKAYMGKDDNVYLFRPEMNARRFANSNRRMCMPEVPEDMFIEAISEIVKVEKSWIPTGEGESLYIRPFMYANQSGLGVDEADSYRFMIVLCPVGAYYPQGVNPVKIYVEDELTRTTVGGTGFVKCGGNYAGSLAGQVKAQKLGYTQVLWLDGVHRKYVEEVGSMNAMFLVNDTVITAPIEGTVLAGVTRDSIISLLKSWGYKVEERKIEIDELIEKGKSGELKEAWGTGTAAVISPIGELFYKGDKVEINDFETGELTKKLYDTLTGIQWGNIEDKYNWRKIVK